MLCSKPVALDFQPVLKLKVDAVGAGGKHGNNDNNDSQRIARQRPHPYRIAHQHQKQYERKHFNGVHKFGHDFVTLTYPTLSEL
jgi:hypothetical protein